MTIYCLFSSKARVYYRKYIKKDGILITIDGVAYKSSGSGDTEYVNLNYCDENGTSNDTYTIKNIKCSATSGCGATVFNGQDIYQAQLYKNNNFIYKWIPIGFDTNGASLVSITTGCKDICVLDESNESYIDIEKHGTNPLSAYFTPMVSQWIEIVQGEFPWCIRINLVTGHPSIVGSTYWVRKTIKEICSDENCLPPEYRVICGETCPSGTCEVKCGNKLCCYDSNGNVVKTINI